MRLKRLLLPAILLLVSVFVKAQKSNEFTVLQWNVWQEGTMIPGGYDAIINEIVRLKPDFVTFSEVRNYNKTNFTARVCASLQEKGLKYYSFYTYDTGLLSKHPITDSLTVFPEKNDHGSIYRLTSSVNGKKVAVYTAHLDYLDCAYYNARGYDGSTWKEIPLPASVDEIMKVNVASQRDDAIRMFIAQAEWEGTSTNLPIAIGLRKIRTCTTTTALLYPGQLPLCWKKLALLTATVRFIPIL